MGELVVEDAGGGDVLQFGSQTRIHVILPSGIWEAAKRGRD